MDKIGKYIKRIPSPNINRTTIFTTFNYAFRNYYSSDFYYKPDPIINSNHNCRLEFRSYSPGNAVVDWGDGQVETFKMRKSSSGFYVASWRTLDIDYRKNPASTGGGWGLGIDQDTGEYIRPYPNHHYADDDVSIKRSVVITFDTDIYYAGFNTTVHTEFPILEMTNLKGLTLSDNKYIMEIPYSRITKLKKLENLSFNRLGGTLQYIPDSIFEMENLKTLTLAGVVNLSNIDSSNIRKISKLKNLTSLNLNTTKIPQYIKEFNDLPNLTSLNIAPDVNSDSQPRFDEVTKINPKLTDLNFMGSNWIAGRVRTNWAEWISGKGIENIRTLYADFAPKLTWNLPEYLRNEMRGLTALSLVNDTPNQDRADTFVNNFYDFVTNWSQITMNATAKDGKRNQFYNLYINIWGASEPTSNTRPSGIERTPSGFVKGSSNGNPTTPMEKIYVLKNNYAQRWNIKPENYGG